MLFGCIGEIGMYSETVLQEFNNPHRRGPLAEADVCGQAGAPGEGPYTAIWLKAADGKIVAASFDTYGCPAATATASWLTRWVEGKTVEQASVITPPMLIQVLGGLPLAKEHTAYLAVKALQAALSELREPIGSTDEREGARG
jgi:nitrogen fixation protein NifU and related proteins